MFTCFDFAFEQAVPYLIVGDLPGAVISYITSLYYCSDVFNGCFGQCMIA